MSIKPVSKVLTDKNRLSLDPPGAIHLKCQLIMSYNFNKYISESSVYGFLPVVYLNLFPNLFKSSSLKVKHSLNGFISIAGRILEFSETAGAHVPS